MCFGLGDFLFATSFTKFHTIWEFKFNLKLFSFHLCSVLTLSIGIPGFTFSLYGVAIYFKNNLEIFHGHWSLVFELGL